MRCDAIEKLKTVKYPRMSKDMIEFEKAAKSLQEKKLNSVYFTKADKSNNIVIISKGEYIEMTENFIKDGPYVEVKRDPLK